MAEQKTRAENGTLEALRKEMRGHMNLVTDEMAAGGCESFPDYTNKTGVIHGLALAERMLLDLDDKLIRE